MTPAVRPGVVSRWSTAPPRRGAPRAIAAASSSRCSLVSTGTSAGRRRQRASGRRRSATQTGARGVDQHPIKPRGADLLDVAAVDAQHGDIEAGGVLLDQLGAALGRFDGGDGGADALADRGEQCGLAAGAGAQVQPAAAVGTLSGARVSACATS